MIIFDWQYYLNLYPDLRINGVHTKEEAINHWINYGFNEGKHPNKYYIDYIYHNQ